MKKNPFTPFTKAQVKQAAKIWDTDPGRRGFRTGTMNEVVIGKKSYPPKAIASYANELAGNGSLYPKDFKGGMSGKWLNMLKAVGYFPRAKGKTSKTLRRKRSSTTVQRIDEEKEFSEGAQYYATHLRRERARAVVAEAKLKRFNETKKLECEACGFDFKKTYGTSYIEAHHTIQVRDMQPGHTTKSEDLALVCANCHRMLHIMKPRRTIRQLKALLQAR